MKANTHNPAGDADMLVSIGQLRQALPNVNNVSLFVTWFTITSDGAVDRQPSYGGPGKGALAHRFDGKHRWMHFTSADDWWAYQRQFGEGDPFRTMMSHVNLMARDIAALEVLGPNPEAMRNYLKALVSKTAAEQQPIERVLKDNMLRLRQLVAEANVGDAGEQRLVAVQSRILYLANARRKQRASGSETDGAGVTDAKAALEQAIGELGGLESAARQERRAVLAAEVTRLDGLMKDIRSKSAPQLAPANWRERHQRLRLDDQRISAEIEDIRVGRDATTGRINEALDDVLETAGKNPGGFNWSRGNLEEALLGRLRLWSEDRKQSRWLLPRAEIERVIGTFGSKKTFVREIEKLRWGGARDARIAELKGQRAGVAGQIETLQQAASGLSRRNKRRLEDLRAERRGVQSKLDELDPETATLEGDNPALYRKILAMVRDTQNAAEKVEIDGDGAGFLSVSQPQDAARSAIAKHDALWSLSRGTYYTPVNAWWADAMQTARNLTTAHMLGSAAITAIADLSTHRVARQMAGMNGNLLSVLRGMSEQWSHASRQEALGASLMLDEALHVAGQEARFIEGINTVHWSGYIADRVLSVSGLSWVTQAGKHAYGLGFQKHMAESLHLSFDELAKADPNLERLLRKNGITHTDWEMLRHTQVHAPRSGVRFLRPSEVEAGPGGRELAETYLRTIISMTRRAVVEGTPEARIMWGGGRPGTFIGEVSRNMAQFRSYSAGYLLLHLRDVLHTAQAGRKYDAAMHMANLAVVGTLLGALAIDLNEMASGRDPKFASMLAQGRMPGAQSWGEAFLKSGGLGVYGDFLFASTHFLSKGAVEVLAGPLTGQLERSRRQMVSEIKDVGEGKLDAKGVARWAVGTAHSFTPGTSIWYLKKILSTYTFDEINRAIDPERARKSWAMSERMRKKGGATNGHWWERGELTPRRAPSLIP